MPQWIKNFTKFTMKNATTESDNYGYQKFRFQYLGHTK